MSKINFNTDTVENYDYENSFELKLSEDKKFITSVLTNLYSDPERAAIRETFANACDATEEDDPIEISLEPIGSKLMTRVTIKDHGCGMSPEKFKNSYLSYGSSTKTDDLSSIGAFGFGAKAPLASSGKFTVKTSDGKNLTSAIVYVAENGVFADIRTRETSDKSFTEVSFDLKDRLSAVHEMVAQTCLYGGKNVIYDFDDAPEEIFSCEDITVYSRKSSDPFEYFLNENKENFVQSSVVTGGKRFTSSVYLEIGGVTYPIMKAYSGSVVVIHKNIGDVAFSPSREEVPGKNEIAKEAVDKVKSLRFVKKVMKNFCGCSDALSEMIHSCKYGDLISFNDFIVDGDFTSVKNVLEKFRSGELDGEVLEVVDHRHEKKDIDRFCGRYVYRGRSRSIIKAFSPFGSKNVDIDKLKKKDYEKGGVDFMDLDGSMVVFPSELDVSKYSWYTCDKGLYDLIDVFCDREAFYISDDSDLPKNGLKKIEDDLPGFKNRFYPDHRYVGHLRKEKDGSYTSEMYSPIGMSISYIQDAISMYGEGLEPEFTDLYSCFTYENVIKSEHPEITYGTRTIDCGELFDKSVTQEVARVAFLDGIGEDVDMSSLSSDAAKLVHSARGSYSFVSREFDKYLGFKSGFRGQDCEDGDLAKELFDLAVDR